MINTNLQVLGEFLDQQILPCLFLDYRKKQFEKNN